MKPAGKRVSEMKHYSMLRNDYSDKQISLALELVSESGTPREGKEVHSPFAFLSQAIDQVLKTHTEAEEKQRKKEFSDSLRRNALEAEELRKQVEMETYHKKRKCFYEDLTPDEQNVYLAAAKKKYRALSGTSEFIESAAVQIWINQTE